VAAGDWSAIETLARACGTAGAISMPSISVRPREHLRRGVEEKAARIGPDPAQ
jgi:hypothetical protein